MKKFLFIMLITFFSFSSVVFAKTEIWNCDDSVQKIDTDIPDIFIKHKDKWISAKKNLPSLFIQYNNQSQNIIIYQQGRVFAVVDLLRRLVISFDEKDPIEYDQCELS